MAGKCRSPFNDRVLTCLNHKGLAKDRMAQVLRQLWRPGYNNNFILFLPQRKYT